jgi:hypothetical protein
MVFCSQPDRISMLKMIPVHRIQALNLFLAMASPFIRKRAPDGARSQKERHGFHDAGS